MNQWEFDDDEVSEDDELIEKSFFLSLSMLEVHSDSDSVTDEHKMGCEMKCEYGNGDWLTEYGSARDAREGCALRGLK